MPARRMPSMVAVVRLVVVAVVHPVVVVAVVHLAAVAVMHLMAVVHIWMLLVAYMPVEQVLVVRTQQDGQQDLDCGNPD